MLLLDSIVGKDFLRGKKKKFQIIVDKISIMNCFLRKYSVATRKMLSICSDKRID